MDVAFQAWRVNYRASTQNSSDGSRGQKIDCRRLFCHSSICLLKMHCSYVVGAVGAVGAVAVVSAVDDDVGRCVYA